MSAAEALAGLLPPEAVSVGAPTMPALGRPPEATVQPASDREVATLLSWATREGVGVLPVASARGAGPVTRDGRYVALSTARLAGIREYEAADLTLTAGAGTPFSAVTETLADNRQWAPFDPPHVLERSLGGLVAEGASGPLRTGYGELRHHVLGATVVTGDGRTLRLGGRVVKNVAGYDLLKTVVGSRGRLAVVTSVCLRAFPRPQVDRVLVHRGDSVEGLLAVALDVGTAPVLPASCVVLDGVASSGRNPVMVVRLHGALETVDADQRTLEDHLGLSLRPAGDVLEDHRLLLDEARDHAADAEVRVVASGLPSRLDAVLRAVRLLEPDAIALDSYGGLLRAGTSAHRMASFQEARTAVEEAGGAIRAETRGPHRAQRDPGRSWTGTPPSAAEAALADRLRRAFDPLGVFWPALREGSS